PDNEESKECLEKAIEDNGIKEYESMPILNVTCDYRKKGDKEYQSYSFMVESFDENPTIMDVLPEDLNLKENDVLIPLYLKSSFAVGDKLQLKLDDEEYELNVAGYNENPYFCSSISVSMYYIYVSQKTYDQIYNNQKSVDKGMVYRDVQFRCKSSKTGRDELDKLERNINEDYNKYIEKYRSKNPDKTYDSTFSVNWGLIGWGNQMLPGLVMAIIILFAIVILIIALVIISFSINDFIQRNIKNTGILEASGYTVKELKAALTTQLMLVGIIAVAIGIGIGFAIIPGFDIFFTGLLGLTASGNKSPLVSLIVAAFILLLIFINIRLISRKYNKITVLDALRAGINTHNFKKNYFAFENNNLPVSIVLSLKDTFGGIKKNILLSLVIAVLTVSTLLGFGLMDNFGINMDGTFKAMGFEFGDAAAFGESGHEDELRKLKGVENVLVEVSNSATISYKGKENQYTIIANDDEKYTQNTVMLEGRFPKKDNEAMITIAIANAMKIKLGDVVKLKNGSNEKDYLITGINQRMQNAGTTMTTTVDGSKRLGYDCSNYNYYFTLNDDVTYAEFEKTFNEFNDENDYNLSITNSEDMLKGTIDGLASAMKMVCLFISILTIFIVIFVESLVIRSKITREYRGYGISKALGMTSKEIISQIALSNIPAITLGCIIGALISNWAGKAVVKLAFSYMGIQKITFVIYFKWIVLVVLGIILIAIFTSAMEGRKVKKLIPVEMITEE
ncbi:MAG: ABC transporter permease, partial [Lachnospiraceae bacterium]|nr:ABC transporter permease [Lachnospiraceae bacterium]